MNELTNCDGVIFCNLKRTTRTKLKSNEKSRFEGIYAKYILLSLCQEAYGMDIVDSEGLFCANKSK